MNTDFKHHSLHPILILVRGIPGGGKSYLANELKSVIGTEDVVINDPDAIDKQSKAYIDFTNALVAEGVDEKLFPYRFLRNQAYKGIESNKIVMWNQAFNDFDGLNKTIVNLKAYAHDHGTKLPTLVVEVEVSPELAKKRVAERASKGGHDVPAEAMQRFIDQYQSFADKGHNTVVVRGESEVTEAVKKVIEAIKSLTD